jgi:hypothetical protein
MSGFELSGYLLIFLGVVILTYAFFAFHLHEGGQFSDPQVFYDNLGKYGEFIGGIVGSLWALAGVLLFFATLTYQKNEFELQRIELHKTQKIFQQQNFSTLFINLLSQHNLIVNGLTAFDIENSEWKGPNFFTLFKEKVLSSYSQKVRTLSKEQRVKEKTKKIFSDYFIYHYSFYESLLSPYVKNLQVLFDMIMKYRLDTLDEGEYYSFMTKSNLSRDELFMLYHLYRFQVLSDLRIYHEEFGLFDNLPVEDRVEAIVDADQSSIARTQAIG